MQVLLICGQLIGSTVIDATGFLGGAVREATPLRIAGIVVVMAAAVAMQVPPRLLPLPAAGRAACARGAFGLGGAWCAAHWPRCSRQSGGGNHAGKPQKDLPAAPPALPAAVDGAAVASALLGSGVAAGGGVPPAASVGVELVAAVVPCTPPAPASTHTSVAATAVAV